MKFVISNTETIVGYKIIEHVDLVEGCCVRSKHVGRDIMASLKSIVGGELKGYTELMEESRQIAINRMIKKAQAIGANAVVNVRLSTSNLAANASEILAYGTAVLVETE